MRYLRGSFWHAPALDRGEWIEDGLLGVDETGILSGVQALEGPEPALPPGSQLLDLRGKLVVPGLVDVHTHLPQLGAMGLHRSSLLDWLQDFVYPLEAGFRDPDRARDAARDFFAELVRHGTTTAAVYTTVHAAATHVAFEEAERAGLRAVLGKVMMDRHCPEELREDPARSVRESRELRDRWHGAAGGLLHYAFTPRFLIACSPELLAATARAAAETGSLVQTHLAENAEEVALAAHLHPGRSYCQAYDDAALLGGRCLLAHAVHLDEGDRRLLRERHATLAFCPGSNFFLKSGVMDVPAVRRHGIPFGLGTDCGAGPSLSLFHAMRDALYSQPPAALSPTEVWSRATLGGAEVLGLDDRVGNFLPGKEADFLVLDWRRAAPPGSLARTPEEILSLLVFRGDERVVESTWVRGRRLHRVR
jgi:guanine deaminase